jgi:hypothetical protein
MAVPIADRFYERHQKTRKIVLLTYEIMMGIMLWWALHSVNGAYEEGMKRCTDYLNNQFNFTFNPDNSSIFTFNSSINKSVDIPI